MGTGEADGISSPGVGEVEGGYVGKATIVGFFDIPMPLPLFDIDFVRIEIGGGDGEGNVRDVGEVGIEVGLDGSTDGTLSIFFFLFVGKLFGAGETGESAVGTGLGIEMPDGAVGTASVFCFDFLKLGSAAAIIFVVLSAPEVIVFGTSFALKFGNLTFMASFIWFLSAAIRNALSS